MFARKSSSQSAKSATDEKPVLDALEQALQDPSPVVREAAQEAIDKLQDDDDDDDAAAAKKKRPPSLDQAARKKRTERRQRPEY